VQSKENAKRRIAVQQNIYEEETPFPQIISKQGRTVADAVSGEKNALKENSINDSMVMIHT